MKLASMIMTGDTSEPPVPPASALAHDNLPRPLLVRLCSDAAVCPFRRAHTEDANHPWTGLRPVSIWWHAKAPLTGRILRRVIADAFLVTKPRRPSARAHQARPGRLLPPRTGAARRQSSQLHCQVTRAGRICPAGPCTAAQRRPARSPGVTAVRGWRRALSRRYGRSSKSAGDPSRGDQCPQRDPRRNLSCRRRYGGEQPQFPVHDQRRVPDCGEVPDCLEEPGFGHGDDGEVDVFFGGPLGGDVRVDRYRGDGEGQAAVVFRADLDRVIADLGARAQVRHHEASSAATCTLRAPPDQSRGSAPDDARRRTGSLQSKKSPAPRRCWAGSIEAIRLGKKRFRPSATNR
jgi:hypothetical protein